MPAPTLPLAAGQMTELLTFQTLSESISGGVITPTWSAYATAWAAPGPVELVEQLPGEQSAPRQKGVFYIRRRTTALPFPLRIINRGRTMFLRAAIDDLVAQDRTAVYWEDGLNLAVGGAGGLAETVTVYRPTQVVQADKSSVSTWSSVASLLGVLIQDADATFLERTFGLEVQADLRGVADVVADVRLGDGITVTGGRHAGQNLLVTARRIDPTLPGQGYWALALSRTTEAFV